MDSNFATLTEITERPTDRIQDIAKELKRDIFNRVFITGSDCAECEHNRTHIEFHGEPHLIPEQLRDCDGDEDMCPGVERILNEVNTGSL